MKNSNDLVAETIRNLQKREGLVSDQSIPWIPKRWKRVPILQSDVIDLLHSCGGTENGSRISRRQVVEFGDTPLRLFLSAMVFGYGDRGYGPWRVKRVLEQLSLEEFQDKLRSQFEAAGVSVESSWRSHTSNAKVKFFGPAFATKFAYFSALRHEKNQGIPLIADANTSEALKQLFGIQNSASIERQYVAYVNIAESLASSPEVCTTADEVERALFEIGKNL